MLTSRWSPLAPKPQITNNSATLSTLTAGSQYTLRFLLIPNLGSKIFAANTSYQELATLPHFRPISPRVLWYQPGCRGWYLAGFWKQLKSGAAQHQQRPPPYQVICQQQAHKLLNKRAGFNNDSLLPIREIQARILRSRWKIAFIHNNAFDHFGRWLQICQNKRLTVGHVTWTKNSIFHALHRYVHTANVITVTDLN